MEKSHFFYDTGYPEIRLGGYFYLDKVIYQQEVDYQHGYTDVTERTR